MISEYYRPQTLEEALALLERPQPLTLPLGGGTKLNRPHKDVFAVVDLQKLPLDQIQAEGDHLTLGATTTIQSICESALVPEVVRRAARLEAGQNLRQMATVAGTLVACDGRSPLATVLLALDARLIWEPGKREVGLGDYLPLRGKTRFGVLITHIILSTRAQVAFESVARTPVDLPLVCAAVARWPAGRTRVVLGGYGAAPMMVLDGPQPGGEEISARNAYSQAGDDWASAAYRQDVAGKLVRRCLAELE